MDSKFFNIYSITSIGNKLLPIGLFYFSWTILHYTTSQLYIYYCTPSTLYGFIMSPFLSLTPQCIAIRWIISETGNIFLYNVA